MRDGIAGLDLFLPAALPRRTVAVFKGYLPEDNSQLSKEYPFTQEGIEEMLAQVWVKSDIHSCNIRCIGKQAIVVLDGVPVLSEEIPQILDDGYIALSTSFPAKNGQSLLRISDIHFAVVLDRQRLAVIAKDLVDPAVKQSVQAIQVERRRPKFNLTGAWFAGEAGNRGEDALYQVRQDGARMVASYGDLGKSLSGTLEGTMQDDTVRGKFATSEMQGTFQLRAFSNEKASLSWTDTRKRGDSFGLQRIGDLDADGKTYDLTGTWVGEKGEARYRVSQGRDGRVHAVYAFAAARATGTMDGVVLGNHCLGRWSSEGAGRTEWEIHDANTATLRWMLYPQYPPNPKYGTWNGVFRVKRVQGQ